MSDYDDYEYDEDDNVSLDDVIEDEMYDKNNNLDWSDNLDDMDSGEWDNQYGGYDDDIDEDDIDPWDLN